MDEVTVEPEEEQNKPLEEEIYELTGRLEKAEKRRPSEDTTSRDEDSLRSALSSPVMAGILALTALVLTALNISGVGPFNRSGAPLSNSEISEHLEGTLVFAREEISDFEAEHHRLPENLEESGLQDMADIEYRKYTDSSYHIRVREAGQFRDFTQEENTKSDQRESPPDQEEGQQP